MSKPFPECPLYNHLNCKFYRVDKICAIKTDHACLKKKNNSEEKGHKKKRTKDEVSVERLRCNTRGPSGHE